MRHSDSLRAQARAAEARATWLAASAVREIARRLVKLEPVDDLWFASSTKNYGRPSEAARRCPLNEIG